MDLSVIDSERLFTATPTALLVDLGQNDLKGHDRRSTVSAVRRERGRLALQAARLMRTTPCGYCDGEGTQPCNDCTGGGCDTCDDDNGLVECDDCDGAGVDAVTARTLEAEALAETMGRIASESMDALLVAAAMVGGQDGDDLEARLRYALAVGGAVPGETLTDACARASAERDDLRAELAEAGQDVLDLRLVVEELEDDITELKADLTLARRPWWRRLLGWPPSVRSLTPSGS